MRCLMNVHLQVEAANVAANAGKLGDTIQPILTDMILEAAYFLDDRGQRTGFVVFDMKDVSQIPAVAEPWFLGFNADVEIHPAMLPDDLGKAGPVMARAVKAYGR